MLQEFVRVRQEPPAYRRLFSSNGYDLYIWYDETRTVITGFQILYLEGNEQKVFTWDSKKGYDHMGVDDWDSSRFNKTPLLVADGIPNYASLYENMKRELVSLDDGIRTLVLDVLADVALKEKL